MTTEIETAVAAVFYDHATNHSNAAEASAVARVRREAIEAGEAYLVEANWKGEGRFYWNGGRYDALSLAKSLHFNRAENVVLTDAKGQTVDFVAARY